MARVLLLVSAGVLFLGTVACATPDSPARPVVTVTTSAAPATTDPPSTKVTTTIVATSTTAAPTTKAPTKTKAGQRGTACRKDASQCYEPGTSTKCQTGGCVDAARGMTQRDIEKARDQWLRRHPGWCAAGETGAVAPCSP
ncbi:hypothetical protein ACFQ05_19255 [Amycolatopsis umgeniensis]|uniref:Secreted protein n=1 Tax=Amycolatopsis umgeniensis TaxID=336628 RepID=A0A841BFZ4_9PSEU|nr:hypothetical protein [Amycolatopsis umgeniensis]MBB5857748.1 hypothetical protein [Amycolatopsis umgeniensis]